MNTHKTKNKKRTGILLPLLLSGIFICMMIIIFALYTTFRPFTAEDLLHQAKRLQTCLSQSVSSFAETVSSWSTSPEPSSSDNIPKDSDAGDDPPYIEYSGEQGNISSLQAEGSDPSDQVYLYMLDTGPGPMLYYHQGDIRWGDYLYGGYDPMSRYGCGPTAVAMIVNSFSDTPVDPTDIADWASEHGYYALHSGSYHSLIPDALEAYGLHAESVTDRSPEHVSALLSSGYILVALMGRGALTQNGHFVLFTSLLDNGNICIADPVNYENCTLEWDLAQLLSELKKSYDSGGPLWAVQP